MCFFLVNNSTGWLDSLCTCTDEESITFRTCSVLKALKTMSVINIHKLQLNIKDVRLAMMQLVGTMIKIYLMYSK